MLARAELPFGRLAAPKPKGAGGALDEIAAACQYGIGGKLHAKGALHPMRVRVAVIEPLLSHRRSVRDDLSGGAAVRQGVGLRCEPEGRIAIGGGRACL